MRFNDTSSISQYSNSNSRGKQMETPVNYRCILTKFLIFFLQNDGMKTKLLTCTKFPLVFSAHRGQKIVGWPYSIASMLIQSVTI